MSELSRRIIGIILILASVLLCVAPALLLSGEREIRYRSGDRTTWRAEPIRTERNGNVAVNTADAGELTALYGVGETMAGLIIAERKLHGTYYYAEDLEAVKGIGAVTLRKLRSMIDMTPDEEGESIGIQSTIP